MLSIIANSQPSRTRYTQLIVLPSDVYIFNNLVKQKQKYTEEHRQVLTLSSADITNNMT